MADRELNSLNAFSTTLTAQMGPTDLTATVSSTSGVTSPTILCIEPEDTDQREYIVFDGTFTGTSFVTTTTNNRYLTGSAAGSGLTHPSGSEVRAVHAQQMFEDLHDRVEAHTHTGSTDGTQIDTGGIAAGILAASSAGRAKMAADFFDSATLADKIASDAFDATRVADLFATDSFSVSNVADLLADDSIVSALIADGALDTIAFAASPFGIIAAQSAQPSSPFQGLYHHDTDTDLLYFYNGTAWVPVSGQVIASASGASASYDFTSIPSDFDHLMVVFAGRCDGSGGSRGLDVQYNGDTAANYEYQQLLASGSSVTGGRSTGSATARLGRLAAASSNADHRASVATWIPDYADTTFEKSGNSVSDGPNDVVMENFSHQWHDTSAINQITLLPTGGSFIAGSIATLIGIGG